MVKNQPVMPETLARALGGEDSLEEGMAPLFLPGESLWTEGPEGLQSMGPQRVGHDSVTKHSAAQLQSNLFIKKKSEMCIFTCNHSRFTC